MTPATAGRRAEGVRQRHVVLVTVEPLDRLWAWPSPAAEAVSLDHSVELHPRSLRQPCGRDTAMAALGAQGLACPSKGADLRMKMRGLSHAEAIDPSVTSPLCAANAVRTSSFSRGGTPK